MTGLRLVAGRLGEVSHGLPRLLPKANNVFSAQGLRYERKLLKALGEAQLPPRAKILHNPWFDFEDRKGCGTCVPDIVIDAEGFPLLVLEAKLTFRPEGVIKLQGLYLPVLTHFYKRPAFGILVTKALTRDVALSTIVNAFVQAFAKSEISVLHWLGQGELAWD